MNDIHALRYTPVFKCDKPLIEAVLQIDYNEVIEKLMDKELDLVLQLAHTMVGDSDLNISDWQSNDTGEIRIYTLKRKVTTPLFTKTLLTTEIQYTEKSIDEFNFTTLSSNPDVPYGTAFEINTCLTLSHVENGTHIALYGRVNWLKSCSFKSIVEMVSMKEICSTWTQVISLFSGKK